MKEGGFNMIKKLLEKLNFFKSKDYEVLHFIYVKSINKYYCIFKDGVIWNVPYDKYPEWKQEALKRIAIVLE
jgi:hypothetical protein